MESSNHHLDGVFKKISGWQTIEDLPKEISQDALSIVFDAINSTVGGLIIADLQSMVRFANPSFCRMFEYSNQEIIGKSAAALFSSLEIRDLSDVITKIDITQDYTKEFTVKTKENKRLIVEVAASDVNSRSGMTVGRMASFVDISKKKELESEREKLIVDLKDALNKIKTLRGIVPICASCKKIRDDRGYWNELERYIKEHSEADFSHGLCPDCAQKIYPELSDGLVFRAVDKQTDTQCQESKMLEKNGGITKAEEDPLFSLLDGASSQAPIIAPELEMQKRIARDKDQPLSDRLEAFEDIIDSEVGDTTLSRARNIEREVGLRQIYLKFEGGNPTGTQKDRIAFAQAKDAMRRGYDAITLATCGNYGVATALAAFMAGVHCVVFIPHNYHSKRVKEMSDYGVEIIRVQGDYETAVIASRKRAKSEDIYDANPGGNNIAIQYETYGEIAYEIYDELRDAPAVVAVPVSNGTTAAGIYKGFVSLHRRGKTSRIPRIVVGSSHNKNPIIWAHIKNSPNCDDLPPEKIKETTVNEPLINWHSIDGDQALEAVRTTGGWASYASDKVMLTYSRLLRDREGLSVLPASTAGLIALIERHRKEPLSGDRYVAVLTGRK